MTRLRITPEGRICGLWSDDVPLTELGVVQVWRASHVEFDVRLQRWCVKYAGGNGDILYHSMTRAGALAWEHRHFQPGGPGWSSFSFSPAAT
jgi:hypothetical protein